MINDLSRAYADTIYSAFQFTYAILVRYGGLPTYRVYVSPLTSATAHQLAVASHLVTSELYGRW